MRKKNLNVRWHPTKNLPLTPSDFTAGSNKKVWWICDKGHEWAARVFLIRSKRSGCPICCGFRILRGFNDLATLNPVLAREWDYSKNTLNPTEVTLNSNRKVWWICSICSRNWEAAVNNRNSGMGCSCTTKQRHSATLRKNKIKAVGSLAEKNPELASEWHPTKNGILTPHDVTCGTDQKVWWLCSRCHNEWEAIVNNRNSGIGCVCTRNQRLTVTKRTNLIKTVGSLAEKNPKLASEWHPTKNTPLKPQNITCGTDQKVWWLCPRCSNEWESRVNNRNNGRGCPNCRRRRRVRKYDSLAEMNPYLARELHPVKNDNLTSDRIFFGSHIKVWWLCSICKHEWVVSISNRNNNGSGCPKCSKHHSRNTQTVKKKSDKQHDILPRAKPSPNALRSHPILLSSNEIVIFELPLLITENDAKRITKFINSFVVDNPPA